MYYGKIKNLDIANGPGIRVSLFVSGCRNHCKGCFQPETWSFTYGQLFEKQDLLEILHLIGNPHIAGLSILGGDPMEPENQDVVTRICESVKRTYPEKSIWMWTGYLWEDVKESPALKYVDVLVDGPFVEEKKNLCLYYRGSENQRVIDVKMSLNAGEIYEITNFLSKNT